MYYFLLKMYKEMLYSKDLIVSHCMFSVQTTTLALKFKHWFRFSNRKQEIKTRQYTLQS